MVSTGLIPKIFEKMQDAKRPPRFTYDFLEAVLGYSSGNARAIIPLLKRMKLLGSDGVPTALYDRFRSEETRSAAIAQGVKNAFSRLFEHSEYAYKKTQSQLKDLVVEVTGGAKDDTRTKAIVRTFLILKDMADFESEISSESVEEKPEITKFETSEKIEVNHNVSSAGVGDNVDLRLGYTINLNLPETTNIEVFNAIFRSLKENLLRNS